MEADEGPDDGYEGPQIARTATWIAWVGCALMALIAAFLTVIAPDDPWRDGATRLLVSVAVLVVSFLCGTRFGMATHAGPDAQPAWLAPLSMVPAIIALLCLLVPAPLVFALLALVFAAQGALDTVAVHLGAAPLWYGRMRGLSTFAMVAALVVAFAATA